MKPNQQSSSSVRVHTWRAHGGHMCKQDTAAAEDDDIVCYTRVEGYITMHARVVHMWSLQSLTRVSYFSVTVSSISREVYTVTIRSSARKIRYPVRRAFSRDMLRLRLRFCRRRATSCACRSPLEVANVVDRMTSWMKNIQQ